MMRSIELITLFTVILALMAFAFTILGALRQERRTLSWIFAGMFGFMAALTATVSYLVLRTLPQ